MNTTTKIEFTRFTQPDVLWGIGVSLMSQFLERFRDDLKARNLPVPDPSPQNDGYFDDVTGLLSTPGSLPESMCEALLAIEELAVPENERQLHAALCPVSEKLALDPDASAEKLALQLWLYAPYQRIPSEAIAVQPLAVLPPSTIHPATINEVTASPVQTLASPPPSTVQPPQSCYGGRVNSPTINQPPAEAPEPTNSPTVDSPTINQFAPSCRQHTGKVARLPHESREAINGMIRDGVPYAGIIEKLGEPGKGLTYHNLKHWRKGGYQEWLQEHLLRERTRAKEQFALDILRQQDASKFHEAVLQLAATHLCQFWADFDPAALRQQIQTDPRNFVRLLNVLPKLSESGLKCEMHRVKLTEQRDKMEMEMGGKRGGGITPETIAKIEEAMGLL